YAQASGSPFPTQGPEAQGSGVPPATVPALIDTGAHQSMIDEALALQLQLPLINQEHFAGVGGPGVANVYLALVQIPSLGKVQFGAFMGAQLRAGGQVHQALLGRTFLQGMILVYDGAMGSVRIAS